MKERSFIAELEKRAEIHRKLANTEIIPAWAKGIGNWLATNPWRVVVPIAVIVYVGIRLMGGIAYREFILGLFGGFAR
jgi:hypothetical protein